MSLKVLLVRSLLAVSVLAASVSVAHAQDDIDVLEGKPSILEKKMYLEGRHTIAPFFALTINDEYTQNIMGGLSWRYFLESWLGIGVDIAGGAGIDTDLTDKINTALSTGDRTFALSTSSLQLLANATAEFVPISGKFMIFGGEGRIDFHIDLGVGVALVAGSGRIEDSISVMPVVGVGFRFFPTQWIAIGLDFRDHIISRVLASNRDGSLPGAEFGNNWVMALSIGFFFPTEPEILRKQ